MVARIIADKLGARARPNRRGGEPRRRQRRDRRDRRWSTAPPDGHTLLVGQTAEIVVNQYWIKGLTYDPKDLQPVALATVVPLALAVPGKAPYAIDGRDVQGDAGDRASRSPSPPPAPARPAISPANF